MRRLSFVLILVTLAGALPSQSLGTDLLLVAGSLTAPPRNCLLRMTPAGRVTTAMVLPGGDLPSMVTMDVDNRTVIMPVAPGGVGYTGHVIRVDPKTGRVLSTLWKESGQNHSLEWVDMDQNGDFLFSDLANGPAHGTLYRLPRSGTKLVPIYRGTNEMSFNCFVEDRTSGDWILGNVGGVNLRGTLLRVDRASLSIKATIRLPTIYVNGLAQDPHRPDIYVASTPLYRYDPTTNTVSTFAGGLFGGANGVAVDRAPAANGALVHMAGYTSGAPVESFDRSGKLVRRQLLSGFAYTVGVAFDRGRSLSALRNAPPNDRFIRVSFPSQPGRSFLLALSLSGYTPGVTLPDGRVVPLVVDALTALTVLGPLPPLLMGNHGVLSAHGEATVRFNANPLGSAVKGVRVWAVALTLDPQAPLGIGRISTPLLFVLE